MQEFGNCKEEIVNTSQKVFDDFNSFIFSSDTKILAKLIARVNFIRMTMDVPGDIVECGVFKGSGIITWLKAKKILSPNSFKKIIGFDIFEHLIEAKHRHQNTMVFCSSPIAETNPEYNTKDHSCFVHSQDCDKNSALLQEKHLEKFL